jgi:hypothetical protein
MDHDTVLAKCHLHAVLPLLEELVEYDDEAKRIVADWNGSIQFSCPGGIAEHIHFAGGKATAHRGAAKNPTAALWFFSPKELNKLFTGEGFTVPIPWKGLFHLNMLKGFGEISKRLEYYMNTPFEVLPAKHKNFVVKMKLYAAGRALKEVGENDPHVAAYTQGLANGAAVLKITGGPAVTIRIRNGILSPEVGDIDSPNAVMEFGSFDIAAELFDDKIDAMAAIGSGDIKLCGMIPMIDNLNAILDRVSAYLA